jgi:hypothetical protein
MQLETNVRGEIMYPTWSKYAFWPERRTAPQYIFESFSLYFPPEQFDQLYFALENAQTLEQVMQINRQAKQLRDQRISNSQELMGMRHLINEKLEILGQSERV